MPSQTSVVIYVLFTRRFLCTDVSIINEETSRRFLVVLLHVASGENLPFCMLYTTIPLPITGIAVDREVKTCFVTPASI